MDKLQHLVGLALLIVFVDSHVCLVKEETMTTLTCTVPSNITGQLFWKGRIDAGGSDAAYCVISTPQICQENYDGYTASITSNATSFTSSLTISSVTRINQGPWNCIVPNQNVIVAVCDMKVYAKPIEISCSQPELQNDDVRVTCTGEKVYPEPLCKFTWIRNGQEMAVSDGAVSNQTFSTPKDSNYFYPKCTWTTPVQSFGFGSHQFKVLIYPNVTGTNDDRNYGTDSSLTLPVNITAPEVYLYSCSEEYIQEGTTVSCTCREIKNSFLQADISWSGGPGVPSVGKQESNLTFQAAKNSPNYTCQAVVLNNTSAPKVYMPKVAYGPYQVVVTALVNNSEKTVIDLCDNTPGSEKIKVSCSVPGNDFNPNVTFQFFINGTVQTPGSSGSLDYSVTKGGNLSVKCRATNTKFQALYVESENSIQVREPPGSPVIEVEQGSLSSPTKSDNQLTVKEGMARIRCLAEGGYPPVTDLALNYSGANTTVGNGVFLDVNITRKMNSQPCYCTASHISSCYVNNKVMSTFNVLFAPIITSFSVNGSTNLTVHNNTDVMFSCEAEGNPSPDLFLLRDSYSNKLGNIDSNNQVTFKFNKTMTCQDTGVYVCKAQTQKTEKNESVQVNVLCKQQLEHSESQNRVYRQCINQSLDFNIAITGYPQPTLLLRSDNKVLGEDDYFLTYSKLKGSSGIVFIKFFSISSTYFQNYSLDITNSEGTFIYNFQILECEKTSTDQRNGTGVNVGAVVGGIIAGIVVIILVTLLFVIARRKGFLKRNVKDRITDHNIQTLPLNRQKETDQEDLHLTLSRVTNRSEPNKGPDYENTVPDLHEDVPPYSRYEELTDLSPVSLDNPSDYANNGFSDTQDNVVQYENTVSAS